MRHQQLGLQMIMDRRQREETNQFYYNAARDDSISRQRAQFETRTKNRFDGGELKRRAQRRANEAQEEIEDRRQRLRLMLRDEDAQYAEELEASIETPMQRRQRLMKQLEGYKQKAKEEHDEEVRQKLYNKWREECDPLRFQISQALVKQVVKERDQQVAENDMKRMVEDQDEANWARKCKEDTEEFRERQRIEYEDYRRKQHQNKHTWTNQMNQHQDYIRRQRESEEQEGLMYKRMNEEDIRRAKIQEEERKRQQELRRKELDTLNADQIQRRRKIFEDELKIDLKYTEQAKEELRREQEEAMIAKLTARRKNNANRELLQTQLNKQKESEEEAQLYIQAAQEEANFKEDEKRRIDAERRRRLMLDAKSYQSRQMDDREQEREIYRQQRIQERIQLERELEEKRQRDREEYEQRRMMVKNQQQILDRQTAIRRENEARRKIEEQNSVKALLSGWAEEEEKIKRELANPNIVVGNRFRGHR